MLKRAALGIPSVAKTYSEDAYEFSKNFISVVLRLDSKYLKSGTNEANRTRKTTRKQPEEIRKETIGYLSGSPCLSRKDLVSLIGVTEGSVRHHLNKLQEHGILKRVGPDKGEYWMIVNSN